MENKTKNSRIILLTSTNLYIREGWNIKKNQKCKRYIMQSHCQILNTWIINAVSWVTGAWHSLVWSRRKLIVGFGHTLCLSRSCFLPSSFKRTERNCKLATYKPGYVVDRWIQSEMVSKRLIKKIKFFTFHKAQGYFQTEKDLSKKECEPRSSYTVHCQRNSTNSMHLIRLQKI